MIDQPSPAPAVPPRVFISYAQFSDAHSRRVLALAQALRAQGPVRQDRSRLPLRGFVRGWGSTAAGDTPASPSLTPAQLTALQAPAAQCTEWLATLEERGEDALDFSARSDRTPSRR